MDKKRNNKWRLALAMIALPIFLAVALLTPDLDAPDLAKFPVEDLATASQTTSIDEVLKLPERSWSSKNSGNYRNIRSGATEIWRRIKIPPSAEAAPKRLVVDATVLFFSEIDFFLVENASVLSSVLTGMDRPSTIDQPKSARHSLTLEQHPSRSRTIYVRSAADFLYVTPLVIRAESRDHYVTWLRNLVAGIGIGSLIGLMLYNLVLSFHLSQNTYRHYAVYLASVLALAIILNGTALDVLGLSEISFSFWMKAMLASCFLVVAGYLNFTHSFLHLERNYPHLDSFIRLTVVGTLVAAGMSVFMPTPWALALMIVVTLVVSVPTIAACLPKLHIPEIFIFFLAISGVLFGAIVQAVLAPITAKTILCVDGVFLLGSLWGAFFLSIAIVRQVADVDKRHENIEAELANHGPKTALNAYLDETFTNLFDVTDLNVSIMFVDIASFSRMAELVAPEEIFVEISRRLEDMTRIILEYGGTIDRSLGDGILCFFGYQRAGGRAVPHVKQAYQAAVAIQRKYLADSLRFRENSEDRVPLPVRIGIHTDKVTIGNMGTTSHLDFTMVGNGVNFANRLETACGPYRIMVSSDARNALIAAGISAKEFDPVMIAVKHQLDLVAAFEVNPHADNMKQLIEINLDFMDRIGAKVRHSRLEFSDKRPVLMTSQYGIMQLKDYSAHGFFLRGPFFLAQKALISLAIDTQDAPSNDLLKSHGLGTIEVEVRWSRREGDQYDHGVQVVGGHPAQWDFLFKVLTTVNDELRERVA